VIAVINKGKHFGEAKIMLDEVLEINDQAYAEVLRKSYGCDLQKLQNTFNFAKSYNKTGLRTILSEMEKCNQSDDPMLCKIVEELENETENDALKAKCAAFVTTTTTNSTTTTEKPETEMSTEAQKNHGSKISNFLRSLLLTLILDNLIRILRIF
jgi:hypothetical protein